jgi:hypothetical protein
MMIRATFISVFCMAVAIASPLQAQHRYLSALEYTAAIPLGDTRDFISRSSWSGGAWDSRWIDRPHTSIGALIGFTEFYHRDVGTFTFPAGAVTGQLHQHLITVPVLVTGAWYFTANRDDPRWYIGGGGGLEYTEQEFQVGIDQKQRSNVNAVVMPEVGLTFSAWYGTGGVVALRYHLPTKSSEFLGSGERRFQYISLSLGLGYR